MSAVRVSRGLGQNSQFMRAVEKKGAAILEKRLQGAARLAEREFDNIVAAEFVNDRPGDRRRPGRHLLGSSVCIVEGGRDFPMKLTIKSLAPSVKVNSLNYGAQPHGIDGNPWLVFPAATSVHAPRAQKHVAAYTRQKAGGSTGARKIRTMHVDHPGNQPHRFLERALERAVAATLGAAVARRRG